MTKTASTLVPLAMAALLACGCASVGTTASPGPKAGDAAAKADRPAELPRYLPRDTPVASLAFLPPPPAAGSAAFAQDRAVARDLKRLRGTARWRLATEDANLEFPHVASAYACALGTEISPASTPALIRLLQRSERDLSRANSTAKDHYLRRRPFVVLGGETCLSTAETDDLRNNGSYPSGHAGRGWLWGLIASEVAPDRAPALMARGRAFAESRAVCNVHWRSDILAARDIAATLFGQLHQSAEFRADLAAAQAEVAAARARGAVPNRDCAAEAEAIAELPALTY